MTRIKLLLLSVLGILALTTMAAATASAEPTVTCTPTGNSSHTLTTACIQNSAGALLTLGLPALETIELLAKKIPNTNSKLVTESGLEITCTEAVSTSLIDGSPTESASLIEALVTFTGCTVNIPNCELDNGEIKTELLAGTPAATLDGQILFTTSTGVFATFTVLGKECAVSKEILVHGNVLGTVLTSSGTLEEGTDTLTKILEFEGVPGLLATEEASTFTLFLAAELDRPSTWSATNFPAHPLFGLFLTAEIP
jgi:hypothetical protein